MFVYSLGVQALIVQHARVLHVWEEAWRAPTAEGRIVPACIEVTAFVLHTSTLKPLSWLLYTCKLIHDALLLCCQVPFLAIRLTGTAGAPFF